MPELHPDIKQILISRAEIQERVIQLAARIDQDYAAVGQVVLIGILKGAFIFLSDLSRALTTPHMVDFMAVSSYGDRSTPNGAVRLILDLRKPIKGKHVIIVEDIVDTGQTLHYLFNTLKGRDPASIRTCALLQKKRDRLEVPVDYLGFELPDVWVVGYGLDYADTHRTLPYVAELKTEAYE
jgi:hypoxanthine phosphoribosyltransferase